MLKCLPLKILLLPLKYKLRENEEKGRKNRKILLILNESFFSKVCLNYYFSLQKISVVDCIILYLH